MVGSKYWKLVKQCRSWRRRCCCLAHIFPGREYSCKSTLRLRNRPHCGRSTTFFWPSIRELHFNKNGAMRANSNKTFTTTGSIHLLTPGPERSLAHRNPYNCIMLSIEPSYIDGALQDSQGSESIELIERFARQDPQIEHLVTALHAETRAGAPTGRLFGQSIATALAVYLAQRYSSLPPTLRSYRGGMPRPRLNCVLEYIAAKLHEKLSLAALAEIAGMDIYYFSRLFKQSTGVSPHRYVLEQRIRRAQHFLRTSDMTILEASV